MTELDPVSVAAHYKAAADFWENQAKLLRHLLDQERAQVVQVDQPTEQDQDAD